MAGVALRAGFLGVGRVGVFRWVFGWVGLGEGEVEERRGVLGSCVWGGRSVEIVGYLPTYLAFARSYDARYECSAGPVLEVRGLRYGPVALGSWWVRTVLLRGGGRGLGTGEE